MSNHNDYTERLQRLGERLQHLGGTTVGEVRERLQDADRQSVHRVAASWILVAASILLLIFLASEAIQIGGDEASIQSVRDSQVTDGPASRDIALPDEEDGANDAGNGGLLFTVGLQGVTYLSVIALLLVRISERKQTARIIVKPLVNQLRDLGAALGRADEANLQAPDDVVSLETRLAELSSRVTLVQEQAVGQVISPSRLAFSHILSVLCLLVAALPVAHKWNVNLSLDDKSYFALGMVATVAATLAYGLIGRNRLSQESFLNDLRAVNTTANIMASSIEKLGRNIRRNAGGT